MTTSAILRLDAEDGTTVLEFFSASDNVTATLVALIIIIPWIKARYQRTIGRRRAVVRKLTAISCGNPGERVTLIFGAPVYRDRVTFKGEKFATFMTPIIPDQQNYVERVMYDAEYGWLTVHLLNGVVKAIAFTVRDARIRFNVKAFTLGIFDFDLGRRSFATISKSVPEHGVVFVGANNWGYVETAYGANPGYYLHVALSATQLGSVKSRPDLLPLWAQWGFYDWQTAKQGYGDAVTPADDLEAFRERSIPDTIAIFDQQLSPFLYEHDAASGTIGYTLVRTITDKAPYRRTDGLIDVVRRNVRKLLD